MKTFTWNSTSWFTRAVDCFQEVIHTHEVNLEESSNTRLFYEFINDFLYQAMEEREGKLVAQAGEIDVVSADSPCQSFSTATRRKGSSQRLLNIHGRICTLLCRLLSPSVCFFEERSRYGEVWCQWQGRECLCAGDLWPRRHGTSGSILLS